MQNGIYVKGTMQFDCEAVNYGKKIIAGGRIRVGHVGQMLCKPVGVIEKLDRDSGVPILDGAYFEDIEHFEKHFEFKG